MIIILIKIVMPDNSIKYHFTFSHLADAKLNFNENKAKTKIKGKVNLGITSL